MNRIVIRKDGTIRLEDVLSVADGVAVEIDKNVCDMLDVRRSQIEEHIRDKGVQAYGFNRGFGHNVDISVDDARLWAGLQQNLIRSHACGTGDPVAVRVVRATMFLRLVSLSKGYSGVGSGLVRMLADMLNRKVIPEVPKYGSVGASGDLAPLSHIALGMIGEGHAYYGDAEKRTDASSALEKAGLRPYRLKMKEGLALNNGLQFSTALGILSYFQIKKLMKTAAVATAVSAQTMLGNDAPFMAELHALRPHAGALRVSGWIWTLMRGSPIRKAHRPYEIDGEIQDPYNIRCAGQILGACHDLIEDARPVLETEANSVTDNPLILPDGENGGSFVRVVSGGHFHGMPVAVKLYNLMQAMGIMSGLSNMRCARYVDESRNKGLGADLKWPGLPPDQKAVSSAMMIPEYATAALTNLIWGECMPSHLFSISTDAGQEDHVSMSAALAARVWDTIPRLAEVLAIELAMGAQAASIREETDHIPSKIKLTEKEREKTKKSYEKYEKELKKILKKRIFDNRDEKFDVEIGVSLKHPVTKAERKLSEPCARVVAMVRKIFPVVKEDRYMAGELKALAKFVLDGKPLEAVEDLMN